MNKAQSIKVSRVERGQTLIEFLALHLDISRRRAKSLLDARRILVNGRRVWMARREVQADDLIEIVPAGKPLTRSKPRVLYRDAHYVIIDKPPGIVSTGPRSIEQHVRETLRIESLRAAHRLDRDTTGGLLLACDPRAFDAAVRLFRERSIAKTYRALVRGKMPQQRKSIRTRIDDKSAVSHIKVLCSNAVASYLDVRLETGRTHQIRRHVAGLQHPVVGDKQYGTGSAVDARIRQVPRQMLHAHLLAFENPFTGEPIAVRCRLPADFRAMLDVLQLQDVDAA